MEATTLDRERRKQVKVSLRPDLVISESKYEGRTYYVVKDPISLRYYRFKEQEHFLLKLMDGTCTLDEAQKQGHILTAAQVHEGILKVARAAKCDAIAMASHGRGGIAGVLLGSETTRVLAHSKLPVLVTR